MTKMTKGQIAHQKWIEDMEKYLKKEKRKENFWFSMLVMFSILGLLLSFSSFNNDEYKKYSELKGNDRLEYNCTKDIENFSGEDNNWDPRAVNNCLRS